MLTSAAYGKCPTLLRLLKALTVLTAMVSSFGAGILEPSCHAEGCSACERCHPGPPQACLLWVLPHFADSKDAWCICRQRCKSENVIISASLPHCLSRPCAGQLRSNPALSAMLFASQSESQRVPIETSRTIIFPYRRGIYIATCKLWPTDQVEDY